MVPLRVLIVEDSIDDTDLLLHELRRGGYEPTSRRVDTAEDMRVALAEEPWEVVFSDHSVLQLNSHAALETLKASRLDIPFIIVSGTIGEEQAVQAMKAGASDYLVKGRLARLIPVVQRELADAQERRARRQSERRLHDREQQGVLELAAAYETTLAGWARALDLRDQETEGHSQRVTDLTLLLARQMGITEPECVHMRRGALLHDIGKMGIPDSVLLKPAPLTDQEWTLMRRHPAYALQLLQPIAYLERALDIPYCHHEKWDGTGYPRGLRGQEIPLAARIFAAADIWDAIRSNRPYRPAWSEEKALGHIASLSGSHLDPAVGDLFLSVMHSRRKQDVPFKKTATSSTTSTILVVDDYVSNVDLLKRWLSGDGYDVLTATSGARALELAARHHPQLILLDVDIPEPDGFAVLRHLKADSATSSIPVVFLSGMPVALDVVHRLGLAAEYLTKPIDAYELRTHVRRVLDEHAADC